MSSKQRYCPSWMYDCVIADVSSQFINSPYQMSAIANRYTSGLSDQYLEISCEELTRSSQEVIQFLMSIGGSDGADLLSNFSFFRFYYITKTKKRNFTGIRSWRMLSDTTRTYTGVSTLKLLRAYYYEQRSGINQIGCLGWKLENQPEVKFLRAMAKRV